MDDFKDSFIMYFDNIVRHDLDVMKHVHVNGTTWLSAAQDTVIRVPHHVAFNNYNGDPAKRWHVALTEISLPELATPQNYKGKITVLCDIVKQSLLDEQPQPVLRRMYWRSDISFDNPQYIKVQSSHVSHIGITLVGDNNASLTFNPQSHLYGTLHFRLQDV